MMQTTENTLPPKPELLLEAYGYFLMSRPYSLIEYPTILLLAKCLAEGTALTLRIADLGNTIILLLLWAGLCWFLESVHRHPFQPPIDLKIALAAFVVASVGALLVNSQTLPFAIIFILSSICYAMKEAGNPLLNRFSFVIRGLSQSAILAIGLLLYLPTLSPSHHLIILSVGLMTAARNLVGDMRDIKYDQDTFPVAYGLQTARYVAGGLKVIAFLVLFGVTHDFFALIALITGAFLCIYLPNQQTLHRILVIGSTALISSLAMTALGMAVGVVFIALLYLSCVSNLVFYTAVRRRSNMDY
jgi:hypothetical protein